MDIEKLNEELDEEKEVLIEDENEEKNDNIEDETEIDYYYENTNEDFDSDYEEDDDIDEDIVNEHIVNKKKTFNFLTKYEKNYIMGIRVNQIINGSPLFIEYDKSKPFNIFKIVEQELYEKKLPFKIKRKLPNGNIEIWNLKDLIIF